MPHTSDFLASFQAGPDAPALPERISGRYRLDSALGHGPDSGAFLLRRKEDGAPFVLKTGTGGQDLAGEFQLLGRLRAGLAPEPVDCFEEDGVRYLIRTYLPGRTLAEAWEPGADFGRWAALGEKLCGLLAELHSLDPPVVHRDIKPENIILSPDGTPRLIDFGTARSCKPGQDTDTVRLGTRTTAAPEQYGFSQTDQRTDLYALGVTLRWMVTGSYRSEALEEADCPGWVKRFLRKAAAFDPKDRFPSASAMADALRRGTRRRAKDRLAWVLPFWLGFAAALLCVAAGAGLVRLRAAGEVDFGSPLLEAAVRAELERPEGTITYADLREVRRLAVVGRELPAEGTEIRCDPDLLLDGRSMTEEPRGDVSDLSLLAKMPNLTELCLCIQEVSDLSPLEGLPLRTLYLYDNNITDLAPLEKLPELRTLYIGENPLGDLTPIASLDKLHELNLACRVMWQAESFTPLAGLSLERLTLPGAEPRDGDWTFLGSLKKLERLQLTASAPEVLAALGDCARLEDLLIHEYPAEDLRDLPAMPSLGALSVFRRLSSCEGIQKQARLHYFASAFREDADLAPLAALAGLTELNLYEYAVLDCRPLAGMAALERVNVRTEEQARAIEEDCPGHAFQVNIQP